MFALQTNVMPPSSWEGGGSWVRKNVSMKSPADCVRPNPLFKMKRTHIIVTVITAKYITLEPNLLESTTRVL